MIWFLSMPTPVPSFSVPDLCLRSRLQMGCEMVQISYGDQIGDAYNIAQDLDELRRMRALISILIGGIGASLDSPR